MRSRFGTGWRWLLALTLLAGLALSLRPLDAGKGPENWFPHADKLGHLGYFALLWRLAVCAGLPRGWRLGLGLLLFGAGIELAQGLFSASRSASLADILADAAGLLLGWALTRRIARSPSSSRQPQEHGR